jgi:hypothetical protein
MVENDVDNLRQILEAHHPNPACAILNLEKLQYNCRLSIFHRTLVTVHYIIYFHVCLNLLQRFATAVSMKRGSEHQLSKGDDTDEDSDVSGFLFLRCTQSNLM